MTNIWKRELVGSRIEIVDATNKTLVGVKGKVIDETKNTITLDNNKKILKSHVTLRVNNEIVEGKTIQRRPEDRIKK
ncbi:ribonuclease P protein subunit [Candidatus Woesearchaeota archaeon]|nr:ribonuclease P protein subunit [Candidatus Woesearchaeota archaeon]